MEVSRLQVAFEATGQAGVQRAIRQTDSDIKNLANNSVGAANRIGSAFSGAGKVIAATFAVAAVAGLAKIGTGFLMANANAETLMTTMEIATGSIEKANAVYGEMQKMAAATPFELPELVAGAARIEAFGQSSREVMGMIGDTAAGTMKSIDQVTAAYLDAGMGQFVRLQELGIDATDMGETIRFKWVENGKQMVKEVDENNSALIQSTVAAIWNAKYAGAMEKQSKTFNGMLSTLKDNFNLTMQDMTKGVFNFAKKGLAGANKFFDMFNKNMKHGVGTWKSLLFALQGSLFHVFGFGMHGAIIGITNAIIGFFSAIGDGIGILFDFGKGLLDAFKAGKSVEALANRLPGPLQGVAAAIFGIADAIGDLVRGFQTGGIGEFFSRLGEEARQIASAGIDLGVIVVKAAFDLASGMVTDLWGWFVGKIMGTSGGGAWDGRSLEGLPQAQEPISFGTVMVTAALKLGGQIAEWAGNIWGWFLKEIGVGPRGDGTDMSTGNVSLGDVLIDGTAKLGAALSGIAGNISEWLQEQIVGKSPTSIPVELANVAITLLNPVASITSADMSGWIQGRIDKLTAISAELQEWKLIIFGPDKVEAGPGGTAEAETKGKVQRFVDGWKAIDAKLAWIAKMDLGPEVTIDEGTVPYLNNWLQGWARGEKTITVPFSNWELELLAWKDIRWDAGFGDKAGGIADGIKGLLAFITIPGIKGPNWDLIMDSPNLRGLTESSILDEIYDKIVGIGDIRVSMPPWNLSIPKPGLSFGGLFGALGGAGGAVWGWITEAVRGAIPDVNLPSWNLKLPSPSIVNMSGGDVAANVGLWIATALAGAAAVSATLASWKLKLAAPVIEGISDALAIVIWIEDKLDSFGEAAASLLSWALSLPTPKIDVTAAMVAGWILDAIIALGDIDVKVPFNLIPVLNLPGMKSGGVLGDIKNAAQGGGETMPAPDTTAFVAAMATVRTVAATTRESVILETQTMSQFVGFWVGQAAQRATAGFTQLKASAIAIANETRSGVLLAFTMMQSGVGASISATTATVAAGFGAMRSIAVGMAGSLVSGVLGTLSVLPGSGYGIGVGLGNGIAAGISATIGAVASAAANLVSSAINAAQAAGQISSPSRLMMELGGYMAEGFAVGITRGTGQVNRSMAGLVGAPIRSRASAGAYGGGGRGDTYIIHNPIMGNDARKWMQSQIAKGSARVVSGGIASSRVSEARH